MADDEEEMLLLLFLVRQRQLNQRIWVHDINLRREILGEYHTLIPELRRDEQGFHKYFRMNKEQFDHLETSDQERFNKYAKTRICWRKIGSDIEISGHR